MLPLLLFVTGCTPSLHDTIARGDVERAKAMLDSNPALAHTENSLGKQPLHYAVNYKQSDVLEPLLKAGANVNAADNTGMTALHVAAMMGRKECLWLLAHGADLSLQDIFGDRPSHTAALFGQTKALGALFKAGDTLTEKNNAGLTPLDLAREHRQDAAVEYIQGKLQ